jgi:3-oxoacyl-[acyl-carrier-protein] synthase-3
LLITAETYSKYINPLDKSVRTLFGDAAAATLIGTSSRDIESIGPFVFGTDGSGAGNLIVPTGGSRKAKVVAPTLVNDDSGNQRDENNLYMNGPEIFKFTLKAVPEVVAEILSKTGLDKTNVDYWVFHQANKFMLDHLRKKLEVPEERFPCVFADCGNTVSSTIPIVLKDLQEKGQLQSGQLLALVGFGVGYSWAATITRWE